MIIRCGPEAGADDEKDAPLSDADVAAIIARAKEDGCIEPADIFVYAVTVMRRPIAVERLAAALNAAPAAPAPPK